MGTSQLNRWVLSFFANVSVDRGVLEEGYALYRLPSTIAFVFVSLYFVCIIQGGYCKTVELTTQLAISKPEAMMVRSVLCFASTFLPRDALCKAQSLTT